MIASSHAPDFDPATAPTRVTHLIQSFRVGGLERLVLRLVQHAATLGIRSSVIAYEDDGELRPAFETAGALTAFVPRGEGYDWSLSPRLARALRGLRTDVLHTHHLGPLLYGAPVATALGVRLVHTEHSHEFYTTRRRRVLARTLLRAATPTCVAHEVADWHEAHLGRRPEVIPNGVHVPALPDDAAVREARRRMGVGNDARVIGFVGRLATEKGVPDLVRAFERLAADRPDVRLVLVGDGPEASTIDRLVFDRELGGSVVRLGVRSDVDALLPGFDVVALPSLREGLPLALLEAMAHARPVVATRVGGVPELLAEGGGRLVAPRRPIELSRALIDLIDHPDTSARIGRVGREVVRRRFDESTMLARYQALWTGA